MSSERDHHPSILQNASMILDLLENFNLEAEERDTEGIRDSWPFDEAETKQIRSWIENKNLEVGRGEFLKFIGQLNHDPVRQTRAMFLYQSYALPSSDYMSRIAVLKEAAIISEFSDALQLFWEAILVKIDHANIATGYNHYFRQAEKIWQEVLQDITNWETKNAQVCVENCAGKPRSTAYVSEVKLNILFNLALIETRTGDQEKVREHFGQVCEIFRATPGLDWNGLIQLGALATRIFLRTGATEQAQILATQLLADFQKAHDARSQTSAQETTPEAIGKSVFLALRLLEDDPTTFAELERELKKVAAITAIRTGQPEKLEKLIQKLESSSTSEKSERFEKQQDLGELYLEFAKYHAKIWETRSAVGTQITTLDTSESKAKTKALEFFERAIRYFTEAGLAYHHGETLLERAKFLTQLDEGNLETGATEIKQDLFYGVELIEKHLGQSTHLLLDSAHKARPAPLETALQIINIYKDESPKKSCGMFLREYERFLSDKTQRAIRTALPKKQDPNEKNSYPEIFAAGKKVWFMTSTAR